MSESEVGHDYVDPSDREYLNRIAHKCNLCRCISELDHLEAQRRGIECACEKMPPNDFRQRIPHAPPNAD